MRRREPDDELEMFTLYVRGADSRLLCSRLSTDHGKWPSGFNNDRLTVASCIVMIAPFFLRRLLRGISDPALSLSFVLFFLLRIDDNQVSLRLFVISFVLDLCSTASS